MLVLHQWPKARLGWENAICTVFSSLLSICSSQENPSQKQNTDLSIALWVRRKKNTHHPLECYFYICEGVRSLPGIVLLLSQCEVFCSCQNPSYAQRPDKTQNDGTNPERFMFCNSTYCACSQCPALFTDDITAHLTETMKSPCSSEAAGVWFTAAVKH